MGQSLGLCWYTNHLVFAIVFLFWSSLCGISFRLEALVGGLEEMVYYFRTLCGCEKRVDSGLPEYPPPYYVFNLRHKVCLTGFGPDDPAFLESIPVRRFRLTDRSGTHAHYEEEA